MINNNDSPQTFPSLFTIQDSGPESDNSCISMNPTTMQQLKLFRGDVVLLTNPTTHKQTLAVLLSHDIDSSPMKIKMNHILRKNLALDINDAVRLSPFIQIAGHQKIVAKRIGEKLESEKSNDHEHQFLIEYFNETYRPVSRGDIVEIKNSIGTVQFLITHSQPSIYGLVTPQTLLVFDQQTNGQ